MPTYVDFHPAHASVSLMEVLCQHMRQTPPTATTISKTMRAIRSCTQKGITINTFMLDQSYYLKEFVDQMTRINGGRVFYTDPQSLGEYILVDYVQNKKKRLGRG